MDRSFGESFSTTDAADDRLVEEIGRLFELVDPPSPALAPTVIDQIHLAGVQSPDDMFEHYPNLHNDEELFNAPDRAPHPDTGPSPGWTTQQAEAIGKLAKTEIDNLPTIEDPNR